MKRLLSVFLLVFSIIVSAQVQWHEEGAKFRLELKPSKPDVILFIDLHGMIFPTSLKNGVVVYSSSGKKISYRLLKDSNALFTSGVLSGENILVYLGFDDQRPFDNWNESELGKTPDSKKLQLRIAHGRVDNTREADMLFNASYKKYLQIVKLEKEIAGIEKGVEISGKTLTEEEKINLEKLKKQLQEQSAPSNITSGDLKRFRDRERDIERIFGQENSIVEDLNIRKIFLDQTPRTREKDRNFLGQISGNLLISEAGLYTFAINSCNASHLVVNGKLVVTWPYTHEKSSGWEKTGEIYLKPGLYPLSFYFQKGRGVLYASAAWKKPGQQDFSILEEKDFTPAYEASILGCTDRKGTRSPMVRYEIGGHFFIDRDRIADWIQCEVEKAGNQFTPVWKVGDEVVSENPRSSFALERKKDLNIILSSKENLFPDIKIDIPDDQLKQDDSKIIEPDLYMKLRAPSFIFDDEKLEMYAEIYSGLPMEARVQLKITPTGDNPVFKKEISWIEIEARKDVKTNPFAQDFVFKRKFELNGASFAQDQFKVKFTLCVPPMVMTDESIRFIPLASCPELTSDENGCFFDAQGKRVVPVLHRLSLAEKRTWSFAQSLLKELTPTKKILVIADDFGTGENIFSVRLAKLFKAEGISLEFDAWERSVDSPTMAANLGSMIQKVAKSDADKVVIIPSVWDTDMAVSSRQQLRTLSALIQSVQANKNVKSVVLATPYPPLEENPIEGEVAKGIRQDLKRDYGLEEILDLDSYVREKPEWKGLYVMNSVSPKLFTSFPVGLIDTICQMVLDAN